MKNKKSEALYQETMVFLRYAVPDEHLALAMQVVDRYREDIPGLLLLREYYRSLPEVREEAAERVVEMASYQGVILFAVITEGYEYLYVMEGDRVVYVGEGGREVDEELLAFFGFPAHEDYLRACRMLREHEVYSGTIQVVAGRCPACFAHEGEFHQFGCPVEVCPWCLGQLNRCNCRFDQMGVEQIGDDGEIARFQRLLIEKGRIRFRQDQAPAYPGMGDGLDKGNPGA
jgi:hypothetical protein